MRNISSNRHTSRSLEIVARTRHVPLKNWLSLITDRLLSIHILKELLLW